MPNSHQASILIVDHDHAWTNLLTLNLQKKGYQVEAAADGAQALALARQTAYAVAIVDLAPSGQLGMEMVRTLKHISPATRCIILTSRPTQESLLEAVHEHLFDYLCKPIDLESLHATIARALEDGGEGKARQAEAAGAIRLSLTSSDLHTPASSQAPPGFPPEHPVLVGNSQAMRQIREQIAEVTPTNMTVLVRGESGTGKGVVARLIHELSGRGRKGALVKINCPAIPETLLESELFGHEAGAFTGAEGRKPGRFELACGGTIFMDEIGEIPPNIQVKLLHVIENKEFQRLGGRELIRVDARILAATNASLEQMIASGHFRADLFYRLNEYAIYLPPLRKRVEDIPLLVDHFLQLYAMEFGRGDLQISSEVMSLLLRHPWHGNVRELESVIRRYALTGREESIKALIKSPQTERPVHLESETLRQSEIQTLMTALIESRWNQRRAAQVLGISYSALRRRIEKYGLKVANGHSTPLFTPIEPEYRL